MPNFIRFNLFPLAVTVNDKDGNPVQAHNAARTIVTDDEVFVYVDGAQGPEVFFTDRLEDFEGNASDGWTVKTSEESSLTMTRSGGCGCGSRLKGYNPFPGIPYEKQI
jgi:hypothetical protein